VVIKIVVLKPVEIYTKVLVLSEIVLAGLSPKQHSDLLGTLIDNYFSSG